MDSLSTPCIFCGTDRPIASEICPTCGRGWIDEHIPQPVPPAQPDTPPATAPTAPVAPEPAAEAAHARDDTSPTVPVQASEQPPSATAPPPAAPPTPAAAGTDQPGGDQAEGGDIPPAVVPGQSPDQPPAAATPPPAAVAAAGAGLVFSDSDDTGFEDAAAIPEDAASGSGEPGTQAAGIGAAESARVDDEATSMFAAAAEPEHRHAVPGDVDAAAAETAAEASALDAGPTSNDQPVPGEQPAGHPSAADPTVPGDRETATGPAGGRPEADGVEMTPKDPDELGIIPVVQAQGPPEYLPEPPPPEPPMPSDHDEVGGPRPNDPSDDDLPDFITPEPPAASADQLGRVPLVPPSDPVDTPPSSSDPGYAAATGAGVSESAPSPAAGQPADDLAGAAPEGSEQALERAPEPPPPVAPPGGVIDPDRLIDDVFADDLVDGRPPRASDAMLDDDRAWTAFAAGAGAAAPRDDLTAVPEPEVPEPPATAPQSRPAGDLGASQPQPGTDQPGTDQPGQLPSSGPAAPSMPATAPMPVGSAATAGVGGVFSGQHPDESDFFAPASQDAPASTETAGRRVPSRSRGTQTAIVAVIVVGIVAAWFVVLALITRDSGEEAPVAAGDSDAETVESTAAPETTIASTTSAPTTTAAPTPTVPVIEPVGDPIPLEELQLGAFGLGPIEFGATDGLGRLVASLDQPDAIADAGVAQGLCPDDTGFTAQWGPLSAIFIGSTETNVIVGYQLGNDPAHPTSELTTLSGLQVGDTVADLQSIYADFDIAFEEIDGQLSFILVRQSDSTTLLWGPVTSSEADGIVEAIYSPRDCDAGPAPSA